MTRTVGVGVSDLELEAVRRYAGRVGGSLSEVFRGAALLGPDLWVSEVRLDANSDELGTVVLRNPTWGERQAARRGSPPPGWVPEDEDHAIPVVVVALVAQVHVPYGDDPTLQAGFWLTVRNGAHEGDPAPLFRFSSQLLDWLRWQRALGRWP